MPRGRRLSLTIIFFHRFVSEGRNCFLLTAPAHMAIAQPLLLVNRPLLQRLHRAHSYFFHVNQCVTPFLFSSDSFGPTLTPTVSHLFVPALHHRQLFNQLSEKTAETVLARIRRRGGSLLDTKYYQQADTDVVGATRAHAGKRRYANLPGFEHANSLGATWHT